MNERVEVIEAAAMKIYFLLSFNILLLLNTYFIHHTQNHFHFIFFIFRSIGFLSWNAADCHVNLEEELSTITALALEGEEGKHGKMRLMFFSCYLNYTRTQKDCQMLTISKKSYTKLRVLNKENKVFLDLFAYTFHSFCERD